MDTVLKRSWCCDLQACLTWIAHRDQSMGVGWAVEKNFFRLIDSLFGFSRFERYEENMLIDMPVIGLIPLLSLRELDATEVGNPSTHKYRSTATSG